ncbi:MAG: methylmalonyl-CoA mutase family protein [Flavobacteriales bacterium]
MSNINYPFEPIAHDVWVQQIQKELRDQAERIHFNDPIDGLTINITEEPQFNVSIPSVESDNHTNHVHFERIQDEKESNRRMLLALMQGADRLFIRIEKEQVDWKIVFKDIQLAYIQTEILLQHSVQLNELHAQLSADELAHIHTLSDVLTHDLIEGTTAYFNGFELQQIGAHSIDELSLILSAFHLHMSKNDNSTVVFSVGMGASYFTQLAKIRSLHYLIQKLAAIHGINAANYRIQAHIGWMNKSLADPYTNLLRQTSEAMSAFAGGVHGLIIHPWDEYAQEGTDDFTLRMAQNISNLLVEEAHFDWVQDPMKGSRIVEALTEQLIEKTWKRVQQLTDMDESSMISSVMQSIEKTRQQRREQWTSGEKKLIGIHSHFNEDLSKAKTWGKLPSYLGKEYLIAEKKN